MTSDDARDIYRPVPAPRNLSVRDSARRCDICEAWGDHHTDRCPSLKEDEIADAAFVAFQLVEARKRIKGDK